MADITARIPDCDDCEGGERGKRGKRGHRGHDGHDGATGPTGPIGDAGSTGATGPTGPTDALTALSSAVVYRPNDPDGSRGNVFVTWAEVYAALQSVAGLGPVTLQFDNTFTGTCDIPAGSWDMFNVTWDSILTNFNGARVRVRLLAGALITMPANQSLRIAGHHMIIFPQRTLASDPAPFTNISLIVSGTDTFLTASVNGAVLPLIAVTSGENVPIVFTGNATTSRITSLAGNPVVDIQDGGALFFQGGNGQLTNDVVTSTIPGASSLHLNILSDSFIGGEGATDAFQFPLFTAAGGVVSASGFYSNRYQNFNGGPTATITSADNPYGMTYNEFIKADPSGGAVIVTAPGATTVVSGERITIKDVSGLASPVLSITLVPQGADVIEGSAVGGNVIDTPFGSKTWVSDGAGGWWITSQR